ncbi:hypothetical protein VNN41_03245 [Lactococcus garvieae]|uniref:hypothetical protein n=1 Tax=Lactococcus garvieae TaxID=1363 RepID=UPI0032494CEF
MKKNVILFFLLLSTLVVASPHIVEAENSVSSATSTVTIKFGKDNQKTIKDKDKKEGSEKERLPSTGSQEQDTIGYLFIAIALYIMLTKNIKEKL